MIKSFTAKYDVTRLVWYQRYDDIRDTIQREKQIKAWQRAWKIQLVDAFNPEWNDLYESLV